MSFEEVKKFYDIGLWSEIKIRIAVRKGIITKEQFREIIGKEY